MDFAFLRGAHWLATQWGNKGVSVLVRGGVTGKSRRLPQSRRRARHSNPSV